MTIPDGSVDLGSDAWYRFVQWAPDRDLNPQYSDLPDDPKTGAIVGHHHPDGSVCEGFVTFDTPTNRALEARQAGHVARPMWAVESWEPLTLSPSILMAPDKGGCGWHGFIRDGKWCPA